MHLKYCLEYKYPHLQQVEISVELGTLCVLQTLQLTCDEQKNFLHRDKWLYNPITKSHRTSFTKYVTMCNIHTMIRYALSKIKTMNNEETS